MEELKADPTASAEPVADPRDRRARVIAASTLVLLVVAAIALYAWIQARDPAVPSDETLLGMIAPAGTETPDTGEQAPSFTVETLGGGTFSLEEHIATDGRPVFLNLWATWCGPCREEMPAIDAASSRHPGVAFVGVAVRDPDYDAVASFAAEIGVSYTIAYDRGEEVANVYPILGMPATFLLSENGVILHRRFGQLSEDEIDAFVATYFGG